MKNGHAFALFPDIPHNSDQLSKPSAVAQWVKNLFAGLFLFDFPKAIGFSPPELHCVANVYAVWPVYTVICLMLQRVGIREGGGPPPLAFQYLILLI